MVPTRQPTPAAPGVPEAPSDGQRYVRIDAQWSLMPTLVTTWEAGAAYHDGTSALYVVYGADGNWQATKATSTSTLSTPAAQSGSKPTTLSALRALSYS